jgi:hypothetical protein
MLFEKWSYKSILKNSAKHYFCNSSWPNSNKSSDGRPTLNGIVHNFRKLEECSCQLIRITWLRVFTHVLRICTHVTTTTWIHQKTMNESYSDHVCNPLVQQDLFMHMKRIINGSILELSYEGQNTWNMNDAKNYSAINPPSWPMLEPEMRQKDRHWNVKKHKNDPWPLSTKFKKYSCKSDYHEDHRINFNKSNSLGPLRNDYHKTSHPLKYATKKD